MPLEFFNNTAVYLLILGLFLASVVDLLSRRVPNLLVLSLLLLGLGSQVWAGGWAGGFAALSGATVGLLLLLPLYGLGGLGAGDVKLMAAAGSYMDASTAAIAVLLSINVATVIGLGILLVKGGLLAYLQRYLSMAKTSLTTGQFMYLPPAAGEAAGLKFPCAIAIAIGSSGALFFSPLLKWIQTL